MNYIIDIDCRAVISGKKPLKKWNGKRHSGVLY